MTNLELHIEHKFKVLKHLGVHLSETDIERIKSGKTETHVDNIARDIIFQYWDED